MIRQEMNPIRQMTIAENIFLGREPQKRKGFVDFKKLNENTNELLKELNMPLEASQKMDTPQYSGAAAGGDRQGDQLQCFCNHYG